MYCTACGHTFPDDQNSRFCPECGTPRLDSPSPNHQPGAVATASGLAAGPAGVPPRPTTADASPDLWRTPRANPGVLPANTSTAVPTAPAKQSGGSKGFLVAVGVIATIAVFAIGGNQVITQQRNASATATAVARSNATATAVAQVTAVAVANARATQTAVAQVTATAVAQAQATYTARAAERSRIMSQTTSTRASFLTRFRTYMASRVSALRALQSANASMYRIVSNNSTVSYAVFSYWISQELVPSITQLKRLSNTFDTKNIPQPYQPNFGLCATVLTEVENDIVDRYASLEKYINGRGGNLETIASRITEIDKYISMGLGGAPAMIKSFEDVDQGVDIDW